MTILSPCTHSKTLANSNIECVANSINHAADVHQLLLTMLPLQYGGPAAQEAAASALENLSLDSECEAALAAEGAIEALLQVLKDGTAGAMVGCKGRARRHSFTSMHKPQSYESPLHRLTLS